MFPDSSHYQDCLPALGFILGLGVGTERGFEVRGLSGLLSRWCCSGPFRGWGPAVGCRGAAPLVPTAGFSGDRCLGLNAKAI